VIVDLRSVGGITTALKEYLVPMSIHTLLNLGRMVARMDGVGLKPLRCVRPMRPHFVVLALTLVLGCRHPTRRGLHRGLGIALLGDNAVARRLCGHDDAIGITGGPDAPSDRPGEVSFARITVLSPTSPVERGFGRATVDGIGEAMAGIVLTGTRCRGEVKFRYQFLVWDSGISREYRCEVTELEVTHQQ
jgi:hypothetical protein